MQVILLLCSLVFVLIVELLNSAVEAVSDAVSLETNQLIGRAKDMGSAATLLSLLMAGGLWIACTINHWYPIF